MPEQEPIKAGRRRVRELPKITTTTDTRDILAHAASLGDLSPELGRLRVQLVVAPSAASIVLGTTAALGVIKPQGLTPWTRLPAPRTPVGSARV